jgi:hypothetical protein
MDVGDGSDIVVAADVSQIDQTPSVSQGDIA